MRTGKDGEKLKTINKALIDLRAERATQPEREKVAPAGYVQLRRGVSHIVDSLKMVTYENETKLFEMLAPHYCNQAKDGRKLIVAAMKSSGSLRLESDKIVVQICEQAAPHQTKAVDAICRELNALGTIYPGTDLRIEFDTNRNRVGGNTL